MTNGEKYRTLRERCKRFVEFCSRRPDCAGCEVNASRICALAWLEKEASNRGGPRPVAGKRPKAPAKETWFMVERGEDEEEVVE